MSFYSLFAKQVDIRLTVGLNGFICTTRYGALHWKSLLYEVGRRPKISPADQPGLQAGVSLEPPRDP